MVICDYGNLWGTICVSFSITRHKSLITNQKMLSRITGRNMFVLVLDPVKL